MKKNSFKQKIVLILFGLCLCAVLLEIGLRMGSFVILSLQEYRNQLSIRQKGEYRILCLGESTTMNQWPSPLEEILNQKNLGIKFSVIDKGIDGTNTGIIVSSLEDNLDKYNPQMVITMMGINDEKNVLRYEDVSAKKATLFFKSFRIYKLIKLLHLHISNLKEQEKMLKKVIEINPENEQGYNELEEHYRDTGERTKAEKMLKKAIEINPENENGYIELGRYNINTGEYNKAIEMFKKAIEINPENEWGYIELGEHYEGTGKRTKAEEMFKKAIEINPENEWGYVELGWHYKNTGERTKAEEMFKKAIEINPENEWGYNELGEHYRDTGERTKAEEMFEKAIEINPQSDIFNAALAVLYREEGKYSLAKEYYSKAESLRLEYYNPVTRHNYQKLKEIVAKRGIKLVCVQYPMRSIESLKKMFEKEEDSIFVDNEKLFKKVVEKEGYDEYFRDMLGGDFGHCTSKGNQLLAENIANTILKERF